MPFTPLHFGWHGLVGALSFRHLCFPTFLLANIVVDIQPLLVLLGLINTPLHGISHSLLGSAVICFIFGIICIPVTPYYERYFKSKKLQYKKSNSKTIISAILGGWFHVITDAPIYSDLQPLFPYAHNPVKQTLSYSFVSHICIYSGLVFLLLFLIHVVKNFNK